MRQSVSISTFDLRSSVEQILTLSKARLSALVVFSSVMAALIVEPSFGFINVMILAAGGFLVSASASAANQFLEKDLDAKMKRTENRPFVKRTISSSMGLIFIGATALLGLVILLSLNFWVFTISALSWFLYVFMYTPLKQQNNFAVFVGAIPGALPVLAGTTAAEESITLFAFLLFSIQFLWQFPHFWAIAWLADEDYKKAGFRLLPSIDQKKDESVGWYSFAYALMLIPVVAIFWYNGFMGALSTIALMAIAMGYIYLSWKLYQTPEDKSAKKLMFYSFAYLPLSLIIFLGGTLMNV